MKNPESLNNTYSSFVSISRMWKDSSNHLDDEIFNSLHNNKDFYVYVNASQIWTSWEVNLAQSVRPETK